MPAKNEQFLPSETSKFCIETSVCPVVTKSSKTMMLRCGGMLLAVKTVPTRCFEGAKARGYNRHNCGQSRHRLRSL